jgi:hypothetical protein
MASDRLPVNALAFIGPAHAADLSTFCYVRVRRIDGDVAAVRVVGPDVEDGGEELAIQVSTLELRLVDSSEATLWPGDYVGHPVAFIQASGPFTGQWAYGVATRYEMAPDGPSLSVLVGTDVVEVKLREPLRVIKADPLTYALQVGSTVTDMVLNPKELLRQQNTVIMACRKRRGEIPESVRAILTTPFVPEAVIPMVRPHDLVVVQVRRQHVLNCLMGARKKSHGDLYKDPRELLGQGVNLPSHHDQPALMHFPDDDILSASSDAEVGDIDAIQHENRTLGKRPRTYRMERRVTSRQNSSDHGAPSSSDDDQDLALPPARGASRQTSAQRRVSRTILHERFQGKSCPFIFERIQQSVHTPFLAFPPVCRGLVEFGFGEHGLALMHCRPVDLWDRVQAQESNISFTDFSERNVLRPSPPAASRSDVSSALRSLSGFALHFYKQPVVDMIDVAIRFVDSYKGIPDTDAIDWKLMAFWVTSKFSRFRSWIVSGDSDAAHEVRREFSRTDEDLLELLDLRRSHRTEDTNHASRSRPGHDDSRKSNRPTRQSSVPPTVLSALPRQGEKRMCMKAISVSGCSGDGKGGCFDNKRALFQPKMLPDVVKAFIEEKYEGVAPKSEDV